MYTEPPWSINNHINPPIKIYGPTFSRSQTVTPRINPITLSNPNKKSNKKQKTVFIIIPPIEILLANSFKNKSNYFK